MADRIARHRARAAAEWTTVEEPLELRDALAAVDAGRRGVVVDCLSLWVANLLERDDEAVLAEAAATAELARGATRRDDRGHERGRASASCPATPLGRAYRDVLGRVNRVFADAPRTRRTRRRRPRCCGS